MPSENNRSVRRTAAEAYLGKTVNIAVDHPKGCARASGERTVRYPINCGHVLTEEKTGKKTEVYLLGEEAPVKEYTGRVIGIVYRNGGARYRLVAAPGNTVYTQNEIAERIGFKEKACSARIEALYQKSCGAVVFRKTAEGFKYLCLLQYRSHTYSVPKGHMEAFETEEQTARREIREEAGITVDFIPGFRQSAQYEMRGGKRKTVVLFLARYMGNKEVCPRGTHGVKNEVEDYTWLCAKAAKAALPRWYAPVIDSAERLLRGRFGMSCGEGTPGDENA